jgi:FAD/FMN-containing dehydrogenase
MNNPKAVLAALVSQENVVDDPEILESFSRDHSFTREMKPRLVIKPKNVAEVQKIVKWANQSNTPLVPVSSGPPRFHGDTVPGVSEAAIIDLSGMKNILEINRRNRLAIIEPGVTYSELQPALAKEGLRLSTSLLPRANKSVLTSLLEREPRLNARYQWSSMDPLRCVEIVWGDGNRLWSGSAGMDAMDLERQESQGKRPIDPAGPAQTDFYRFLAAGQGSMGIATWASVRCEVLPQLHKLFFVPANRLNDLLDFTYRILKFRYAEELFLMNNTNMANVLGNNFDQIKAFKEKLPPWLVLVGISGLEELPAERVKFQEKDIREIARQFGLELLPEIAGVSGEQVYQLIGHPSREPYWKLGYRGGCQDFFFITTLDRTPQFAKTMSSAAESAGYPVSDIGVYIQPRHQGVNCHCEFNLPYRPDKPEDVTRARGLYARASDALMEQGAFFSRPYGIWANIAFKRDPKSAALLKNIKSVFDPKGIMNPGKLCF